MDLTEDEQSNTVLYLATGDVFCYTNRLADPCINAVKKADTTHYP